MASFGIGTGGEMNNRLVVISGLCLFLTLPRSSSLAEGERPWAFSVGVTESFNDNRDGVSNDKETVLETRIYPRADFKLYRDQVDLDFYYSPQFLYRNNPREITGWEQKSTDLYHDLGANAVYRWSERLSLSAGETFNLSDVPADMDSSRTFHEFVTYWVNRINLSATYEVLPKRASVVVRGNHMVKKYREDPYAETGDEKDIGGGISARYMLKSGWTVMGDIAYSSIELGETTIALARDADILFVGASVEKIFGLWSARLRVGVDRSTFDVSGASGRSSVLWTGTVTKPGGDFEIAYTTESGMTRIGLNTAYHTLRSDVAPFATQQRTSFSLTADHSFTERIRLGMNGVYGRGEYSSSPLGAGGSDAVAAVGTTLTYVWDRNLSLQATYRFEDWKADDNIRESYRRNIGELSLKAQF